MSEAIFKTFKFLHSALRGSGLGKIRFFRDLRDALYRAVRPQSPRIVQLPDFRLWVDPSTAGGVVPWLLLDDIHEPSETQCIRDNLSRGGTFVDIGANIGYYTVLAAKLVGAEGKVFGFEPEPVNYSTLEKNIALNALGNVTAEPLACSDRVAEIPLYLDEGNAGGHNLHNAGDGSASRMIRTITLDDYFGAYDRAIDLIKMDIQGHEPVALRGMLSLLRRHPETKIITEFDATMITGAGESPENFLGTLQSLGYRFTILSDYGKTVENAGADGIIARCTNGVFVNLFCARQ